ncbi:MAG: PHP domain-containing protein [Desulfurococcaceae archaeon]
MLVKADMHIHTTCSDGRAGSPEVVLQALNIGLQVVSITDHDTFLGSTIATRYAESYSRGILVIPGVEVRTDKGDVLVYCEKEIDFPRKIENLIEKAHSENCIVVPAHPFDIARLGVGEAIYEYSEWDAIEVWNASSTRGSNYKAMEAAKILGKPGLANSDAHVLEEIGVAYTLIEVDDLRVESVLNAIRKGRVKPVFGKRPFSTTIKRLSWSLTRFIHVDQNRRTLR